MHACMHAYIHTYTCIHAYIHHKRFDSARLCPTPSAGPVSRSLRSGVHCRADRHAHIPHTYMYLYIYVYVCVCARTHTHTHKRTHTHIHTEEATHTHTLTHTHTMRTRATTSTFWMRPESWTKVKGLSDESATEHCTLGLRISQWIVCMYTSCVSVCDVCMYVCMYVTYIHTLNTWSSHTAVYCLYVYFMCKRL